MTTDEVTEAVTTSIWSHLLTVGGFLLAVFAIARLMSDDCTLETADPAPDGRSLTGREAVAAYYRDQFQAVPTLQMETEDISGLGHQCIRRSRLTWQDPDGRPHHRRAVDIFKERDGVIVAQAGYVKG